MGGGRELTAVAGAVADDGGAPRREVRAPRAGGGGGGGGRRVPVTPSGRSTPFCTNVHMRLSAVLDGCRLLTSAAGLGH